MIITHEALMQFGRPAAYLLIMRNDDVIGFVVEVDTDKKIAKSQVLGGEGEAQDYEYTDIFIDDRFITDEEIAQLPKELEVKRITDHAERFRRLQSSEANVIPFRGREK
jgi:hypothetical protein